MFDFILDRYKINGEFTLNVNQDVRECCNAPNQKEGGVYIIYCYDEVLYVGKSGYLKNGHFKHREGGIWDRICNGYHPGTNPRLKRHEFFKLKMQEENRVFITIKWWETFNNSHKDFPWVIEDQLLHLYKSKYGQNPVWHSNKVKI